MTGRVGPALADVAVVIVFVALGRSAHDEGNAIIGLLTTAAPFLAALALAWAAVLIAHRAPTALATGALVWAVTWLGGMALRAATGAGTAPAFIVVAGVSLGVGLIGWRAVWLSVTRRTAADQVDR